VIGQPLEHLLPPAHLNDAMDLIKRTSHGEHWDSVEIPILHRDGSTRTVLWNSATIYGTDPDVIISVIAQGQDITDRKEIENELRKTLSLLNATLESTIEGIAVVDNDRKFTIFNRNFSLLWNIPQEDLVKNDDREITGMMQSQVKNKKEFLSLTENLYKHPERESFDMVELLDGRIIERHSKPQKLGEVTTGRYWSYRDITDRIRAEQSLVSSLNEKEVLLREVHHRVKNNLQLISGLIDMTRMRTEDEAVNSILTDLMMKIQTMAQIHTLLYESKDFGRINLTGYLAKQAANISHVYSHPGQNITCGVSKEDVFLTVDQAIPCALVMNEIISNTYKHAFKGRRKGSIEISVRQQNGKIGIVIRDDGIGLPADFDLGNANTLGLKLVRTLIQHQLRGQLSIDSKNGTEMEIAFPIAKGEK
jgi:two-component sensor histidine kinase/PAS domain-containing protein